MLQSHIAMECGVRALQSSFFINIRVHGSTAGCKIAVNSWRIYTQKKIREMYYA